MHGTMNIKFVNLFVNEDIWVAQSIYGRLLVACTWIRIPVEIVVSHISQDVQTVRVVHSADSSMDNGVSSWDKADGVWPGTLTVI